MKNLLFTIALLISFSSFGQVKLLNVYDEAIKQGEAIGYYESGAVKYKSNNVDGKRQGELIG